VINIFVIPGLFTHIKEHIQQTGLSNVNSVARPSGNQEFFTTMKRYILGRSLLPVTNVARGIDSSSPCMFIRK